MRNGDLLFGAIRDHGGIATRADLRAVGVTDGVIGRAVARGHVVRLAPGLFAAEWSDDPSWRMRAALASAGPDAALSHGTAGWMWGLAREPEPSQPIHVTVPHGHRRQGFRGVTVHQSSHLDRCPVQGWPVTRPRQTLIGLADDVSLRELRFATMKAVQRHLLTPNELTDTEGVSQRLRGRWAVVAQEARAGAMSGGEAEYWRLIADSGLPIPLLNQAVSTHRRTYRVDAVWPDYGLGAEIDGRKHHTCVRDFEIDRERQNDLHAVGMILIRFPVAQVLSDPAEVLRQTELNLLARAAAAGFTPKRLL